jgi:hypothetical protein
MAAAASPRCLFLLDELGSGTDPAEGASIGRALLKHFARAGAWAVATTHLGSLKVLAQEETAVVNASMALDPETLAPRFELSWASRAGATRCTSPSAWASIRASSPRPRRAAEAQRSLEALLAT